MKRKDFFCFLFAICHIASLWGGVTPFYQAAMERMALEVEEAKTIYDKALLVEDLYSWLKMLGNESIEREEFFFLLREGGSTRTKILEFTDEISNYLYADRKATVKEFYRDGDAVPAFFNSYRFKKHPPADENERERLYSLEKFSYQKYGFIPVEKWEHELFCPFMEGVSYNFIVTLDGEIYYSRMQNYDKLREGEVKRLVAPNHAILAHDGAVLTAGELVFLGKGENRLWIIAISSGHYRPSFGSGEKMVEKLLSFGIPRESIMVSALPLERLGSKLMRKFHKELSLRPILLENNLADIK